ncbi:MAG: TetR/AcrR family transcriptional regulator [Oscillospiraceae bacterium]|nr:TetR/AcrR family transcriptional regulator [Oscillospiraceae bacterium]MBQ9838508.1 TetR/AcrR family transcriptional regulator [Oscillospiraceae bacterium]
MPPKPKFTKEEIVAAALELVSKKGIEALTARELGARLGSSARPIFTVFNSMEEVQGEVRSAALKRFEGYAEKAMHYTPVFKQVGMQMILFAMEEPKLYQLVYMSENAGATNFEGIVERLGDVAQLCVDVIQRDYSLSEKDAKALFEHVWIYTFGIGALCATGMCRFSQEEIIQMLGQDFMAMLFYAKSGRMNMPTPVPKMEK